MVSYSSDTEGGLRTANVEKESVPTINTLDPRVRSTEYCTEFLQGGHSYVICT